MQMYTDDITQVYVKEREIWERKKHVTWKLRVASCFISVGFLRFCSQHIEKTKYFNTFCENYSSAPGVPCRTLMTHDKKRSRHIQNASSYINKSSNGEKKLFASTLTPEVIFQLPSKDRNKHHFINCTECHKDEGLHGVLKLNSSIRHRHLNRKERRVKHQWQRWPAKASRHILKRLQKIFRTH